MGGLSSDPDKRAAQLANLPNTRGEPTSATWRPGEAPALRHGGRTTNPPRAVLDPLVREIEAALGAVVPLRDGRGEVPAADRVALELAAVALLTVRRLHAYFAEHGEVDPDGVLRVTELKLAGQAEERLARRLADLGMTPRSRVALGLDLTRAATATDLLQSHVAERYADGQVIDAEPAPAEGAPFISPRADAGAPAHPSVAAAPAANPEGSS